MTPNPALDQVVEGALFWRPGPVLEFARSFLLAARRLREDGISAIGVDDVPEDHQPLDGNTSGKAIWLLKKQQIIFDCYETLPSLNVKGGGRPNRRKCCHGHRVQMYQVRIGLADEWLKRNGAMSAPMIYTGKQQELAMA